MARLMGFVLLVLLGVGCGSRSPEFWESYAATTTAAASVGTGGMVAPAPSLTPHPGMALIGAEYNVTQAAIAAQSAQTISDQTRTAYQYAAALASLEAQQAIATQIAPTRFAEMTTTSQAATATHGAIATSQAISVTIKAIEIAQMERMNDAGAIVALAAAQGTATAIAKLAEIEDQSTQAQREELAIANQRARARVTLSIAVPLIALFLVSMVVSAFSYRLVVQARPQAVENGKRVITYDRLGTPLISAPRQSAVEAVAEETTEAAPAPLVGEVVDLPDLEPGVLQVGVYEGGRPIHLGPGFMGIQLTGQKGSGKSSLLRLMAAQALAHGWDVFYADAEALTFDPDLWGPVAQTTADTRLLFAWLREQVFADRHNLYREAFRFVQDNLRPQDQFLVDNLLSYNKAAKLFNMPILKPMLLVWDEANSHLQDKRIQELAEKAFQASRKVGCDSVVAGHNWRATDIPAGLKLQLHNAVVMRCGEQDSKLVLGDPKLAGSIPADTPGAAYIRLKRYQGYMQAYHVPDPRLIQMVREARPQTNSHKPWSVTKPDQPALEMGVEELFRLDEGEADTRPRKLDKNDPRLRQRVIDLYNSEKEDGSRYSGREIELAITSEFCPGVEPYAGGQAYKVVKEIISGAASA